MAGNLHDFEELMSEVHRVTIALDAVTRRDGDKVTDGPVIDGKRIYLRLQEFQRNIRMSRLEAHALDDALEQLRARLKFFGESVGR